MKRSAGNLPAYLPAFIASRLHPGGYPIRATLLSLVAVPLFALTMAMAFDTYRRFNAETDETYRMLNLVLARTVAQTDLFLGDAKFLLGELAKRPAIRSLDPKNCDSLLREIKQLHPAYSTLLTVNANGDLVCSATKLKPDQPRKPDPSNFFTKLSQSQQFTVGRPTVGFVTRRKIAALAYPIFDDAGRFNGGIAAGTDLVNYKTVISDSDLRPTMSVGIITNDGVIIADSRGPESLLGTAVDSPAVRIMLERREGQARAKDHLGQDRIYTFSSIRNTDWIAFSSVEQSSVVAPIFKLVIRRLLFAFVLMVAVAWITIYWARRLAMQVESVSNIMDRVADGELNERAIPRGSLELRRIATRLNAMLDSRDRADSELRESEERFRGLFERTRQASLLIEDQHIVTANRATLDMFGMHAFNQILGRTPTDLSPQYQADGIRSAEKAREVLQVALEQGSNETEWVHLRADGEPFTVRLLLTVIQQGGRKRLHAVLTDISEEKKAIARIKFLAFRDPLTGLPNKVAALDHLSQVIATAQKLGTSVGVLHIDVDKLRYINETHGHVFGDALIKAVGERLAEAMRPPMTLARLLGDDFMVVIDNVASASDVDEICERLLAQLADPYEVVGVQLIASFSIGVVMFPKDGESSEVLLRNADTALAAAQSTGINRYRFFEPAMNAAVVRFTETRNALWLALERNELELHYQPQIDLSSGKVVGAEALVRWNRPNVGLVMPGEFIGVAEESGLIIEIGRWVLNEVCRQVAEWARLGMGELVFAVNISAVQFRHGRLEQDIDDALSRYQLSPANLELELTESILLENDEPVLSTLARWKAQGFHLSIDDFGTGYSSLAYLKRLKVDKLKIDQSFIRHLASDHEDRGVVEAIIQIARVLKLTTIAEGVEDQSVLGELRLMGCDQVQGYLYSRPMPAAEFIEWVKGRDAARSIDMPDCTPG